MITFDLCWGSASLFHSRTVKMRDLWRAHASFREQSFDAKPTVGFKTNRC